MDRSVLDVIEREIDAGDEGRYLLQVAANADVIAREGELLELLGV